jgi:hypothetical protein
LIRWALDDNPAVRLPEHLGQAHHQHGFALDQAPETTLTVIDRAETG